MGGYVTFALFRKAPGRFAGVVLADTKAQADTRGRPGRPARDVRVLREEGVSAVVDTLLPKLVGETTHRERPQASPRGSPRMEENERHAIDAALHALITRPDSTPDLRRILSRARHRGPGGPVTPRRCGAPRPLHSRRGAGGAAARGPPLEPRGAGGFSSALARFLSRLFMTPCPRGIRLRHDRALISTVVLAVVPRFRIRANGAAATAARQRSAAPGARSDPRRQRARRIRLLSGAARRRAARSIAMSRRSTCRRRPMTPGRGKRRWRSG